MLAYQQAQDVEARTIAGIRARAEADILAARAKTDQARNGLAAAIVTAARSGMRQVDIMRITGYSRERVRQITRAGGVEAG